MQSISSTGYDIHFSENAYLAFNQLLLEPYSGIFLIVDGNTHEHCLQRFLQQVSTDITIEIIEIEPGESMKTIATCTEVWTILTELGADRKCLVVNLGGGVITDLGGFIASTYKRGVDFVNVPTTLLGMVDASVGGKNGIDLGNLKNQIGTITSPKMVLIDTGFLQTLPEKEIRSGMAEMLKHGLIADNLYWERLAALESADDDLMEELIYDSVKIKNAIVMEDLTENGIRKALNFGHTLGHAIESHFLQNDKPELLHGEAVAAGMILEAYLSWQKNLLTKNQYNHVKSVINTLFKPLEFSETDIDSVMDLLVHDKKNEYGQTMFALLDGIGAVAIDQKASNHLILSAFSDYKV